MHTVSSPGMSGHQGRVVTSFPGFRKRAKTCSRPSMPLKDHCWRRWSESFCVTREWPLNSPKAGDSIFPKRPFGKSSHASVRSTYDRGRWAQKIGRTSYLLRTRESEDTQGFSRFAFVLSTRFSFSTIDIAAV